LVGGNILLVPVEPSTTYARMKCAPPIVFCSTTVIEVIFSEVKTMILVCRISRPYTVMSITATGWPGSRWQLQCGGWRDDGEAEQE